MAAVAWFTIDESCWEMPVWQSAAAVSNFVSASAQKRCALASGIGAAACAVVTIVPSLTQALSAAVSLPACASFANLPSRAPSAFSAFPPGPWDQAYTRLAVLAGADVLAGSEAVAWLAAGAGEPEQAVSNTATAGTAMGNSFTG